MGNTSKPIGQSSFKGLSPLDQLLKIIIPCFLLLQIACSFSVIHQRIDKKYLKLHSKML